MPIRPDQLTLDGVTYLLCPDLVAPWECVPAADTPLTVTDPDEPVTALDHVRVCGEEAFEDVRRRHQHLQATRALAEEDAKQAALVARLVAALRPPEAPPAPRWTLTTDQASAQVGLDRRELERLHRLAPSSLPGAPIQVGSGGKTGRRSLRFDPATLGGWIRAAQLAVDRPTPPSSDEPEPAPRPARRPRRAGPAPAAVSFRASARDLLERENAENLLGQSSANSTPASATPRDPGPTAPPKKRR